MVSITDAIPQLLSSRSLQYGFITCFLYKTVLKADQEGSKSMIYIDYIMSLLDWNNDMAEQERGIMLARDVKCFNVFFQPRCFSYGKNVWDNCARIISERSDNELLSHLSELMMWLQDMNWPGAFCILERVKKMKNDRSCIRVYTNCLKCARALNDETWEENLKMIFE